MKRVVCLAALGCAACTDGAPEPLLRDVTAQAGVTFRHVAGDRGDRELPETMGAGIALLDHDSDGDLDLYCVQSGPLRTPAGGEPRLGAENELWANDGGARFTRVRDARGADDSGYGQGVAVGDADGDGRDDLYVLNWGANALLVNREGGFEPDRSDVFGRDAWSVSAAFFDADADGDLDLYEVNYLVYPPNAHADPRLNDAAPAPFGSYPHPDRFLAAPDRLLVNDGAGAYRDATAGSGADGEAGKGLGVVPTDVDLDGWTDLYVTNDSTPNFLFRGLGDARFERIGRVAGVAFNDDGLTEAGMGVDTADVDADGDFDLFCTNLDLETNTLYLNRGGSPPRFRDRTRTAGLAVESRPLVGFGTLFADVDADGDQDLLVANGHIIDNIGTFSDSRTFAQPSHLFLGDGTGAFALAGRELAPGLEVPGVARGLACGDLDGDGASDFVISACGVAEPTGRGLRLFAGRPSTALVRITLDGPPGNPRGLGATLWLELEDGTRRLARLESARGYASASEPAVTLGLQSPLRAVEVVLPGGARQRFEGVAVAGARVALAVDG